MPSTSRRRFAETAKPKNEALERFKPITFENGKIMIDFSYPFVFHTCLIKSVFTNKFKDDKEYFENNRIIFGKALNYFGGYTFNEIKDKHNHSVKEKDKLDLVIKILKYILKEYNENFNENDLEKAVNNYIGEEEIWQLAFNQGIRLIGTRNGSVLKLLFMDYHHLIYPNEKYNKKDYYRYSFCPMTSELS